MSNYTETQKLVYKMLTENTGKHMLDSGFANGRHWQRNQQKSIEDFDSENIEAYEFDWDNGDIVRTVSVFHFLSECTELDDICDEFNRIQEENDDWDYVGDENLYGVSNEAGGYLSVLEMMYDDFKINHTWNTYNGDSDLSQVLQGCNVEVNGEYYVIVQTHNGADVRGGYSHAKMFKCADYSDGMIHEYVYDFSDSYDIEQEMEHIEEFTDWLDNSKTYTNEQVVNRIEELNKVVD